MTSMSSSGGEAGEGSIRWLPRLTTCRRTAPRDRQQWSVGADKSVSNMHACKHALDLQLATKVAGWTRGRLGSLTCGWPGSWSCTAAHAFSESMTCPPCAASLQQEAAIAAQTNSAG